MHPVELPLVHATFGPTSLSHQQAELGICIGLNFLSYGGCGAKHLPSTASGCMHMFLNTHLSYGGVYVDVMCAHVQVSAFSGPSGSQAGQAPATGSPACSTSFGTDGSRGATACGGSPSPTGSPTSPPPPPTPPSPYWWQPPPPSV